MAAQDPYAYPGTDVLINIPGFTDPEGWKKAETAVIAQRLGELADHPFNGNFDLPHLQAIHARLVEGFYTWGGHYAPPTPDQAERGWPTAVLSSSRQRPSASSPPCIGWACCVAGRLMSSLPGWRGCGVRPRCYTRSGM